LKGSFSKLVAKYMLPTILEEIEAST